MWAQIKQDVGTFTVVPELKTVHYQRGNSAFAQHSPSAFDWESILAECGEAKVWLHMTGITPMIAEAPRLSWTLALQAAHTMGVPVSMDFNHRPQLGTLSTLWAIMLPQLPHLEILILSVGNLVDLAKMYDAFPSPSFRDGWLSVGHGAGKGQPGRPCVRGQ